MFELLWQDWGVEDAAQIVKALAVHRYCNNDEIRIIAEVLEPETEASAVWDLTEKSGIEVICPIKYHFRMIARRYEFLQIINPLLYNIHLSKHWHGQTRLLISATPD